MNSGRQSCRIYSKGVELGSSITDIQTLFDLPITEQVDQEFGKIFVHVIEVKINSLGDRGDSLNKDENITAPSDRPGRNRAEVRELAFSEGQRPTKGDRQRAQSTIVLLIIFRLHPSLTHVRDPTPLPLIRP